MVSKERLEAISGVIPLEHFPAAEKVSRLGVMYKRYYRYLCQNFDAPWTLNTKMESDPTEIISPFGGETKVVLDIEGRQYVGVAVCSEQDNFSRKVGRKIAILRAFSEYRNYRKTLESNHG